MKERTILLVEDDPAIAALVTGLLEDAQYAVDGPYATLADSVAAVAHAMPAGAILDVHLRKGDAGLLADDLDLYDIPYLFCTGLYDHAVIQAHPAAPLIAKPDLHQKLLPALDRLLH